MRRKYGTETHFRFFLENHHQWRRTLLTQPRQRRAAGQAPAPATKPSLIGLAEPFQPTSSFRFPAWPFGNETLAWFARWQCLHYVEETDLQTNLRKTTPSRMPIGVKSLKKFKEHERSELHSEPIQQLTQTALNSSWECLGQASPSSLRCHKRQRV